MRLAIMQPYFFPYLGHFSLIAACDEWIVFDICQYAKRSWMNRNRVLHPNGGWQWVTAPLSQAGLGMRTDAAMLLKPDETCRRVLGQLSHYRDAPYFEAVREMVRSVFQDGGTSLVSLNVRGLEAVCRHIGLPFRYRVASALELALPEAPGAGGWAPAICAALGAAAYVNPIGGRGLFDLADFERRGVELGFVSARAFEYPVGRFGFEPGLSILDVLMWNAPDVVLEAVRSFEVVPGGVVPGGVVPGGVVRVAA